MGFKTGLIIGTGIGYVLGARAGRQRYEEIRRLWGQVSASPAVQKATEATRDVAGEGAKRGFEAVQHGVERAGAAVRDRLHKVDGSSDEKVVDLIDSESGL